MLSPSIETPSSSPILTAGEEKLDCFVTRQPIFHADGTVYGYEMLFHSYPNAAVQESEARLASLLAGRPASAVRNPPRASPARADRPRRRGPWA